MKFSIATIAAFASALATAAPSSSSSEFTLSVADTTSPTGDLNNRKVIFHGSTLLVSGMASQHGVNFSGGGGSLAIENGDRVYVAQDGHLSLSGTDGVPSGAITNGFTFSGDELQFAQGAFYACQEQPHPAEGDAPNVEAIYAAIDGVSFGDNCVAITLNKASV
ncbi:hypothetical protein BDW74DRAFT_183697 [Aspergillus multicolor]|uniref:uncharacterized protein n=1 Tax=Aspergillus multicolor TaxID=41759 RepID=UPI003CCDB2D5